MEEEPQQQPANDYTVLDNAIRRSPDVSGGEKIVYMALVSFCFGDKVTCYPTVPTLSDETGMHEVSVTRALKRLETAGWLLIARGTGNTPSRYTLQFGLIHPRALPTPRDSETLPQGIAKRYPEQEEGYQNATPRDSETLPKSMVRKPKDAIAKAIGADALRSTAESPDTALDTPPTFEDVDAPPVALAPPNGTESPPARSAPFEIAAACMAAGKIPLTNKRVKGKYISQAQTDVVEAYHGKAGLNDVLACIAYLQTDPWYETADLTPSEVGKKLGKWLVHRPATYAPPAPPSKPAPTTMGRSQVQAPIMTADQRDLAARIAAIARAEEGLSP